MRSYASTSEDGIGVLLASASASTSAAWSAVLTLHGFLYVPVPYETPRA